MFLASAAKPIDENLKNIVEKIEAQSSSLSVLAARQFRYALHQTTIEVTIKEPRQFNVLEEFIIRAGLELKPPPTADELASLLGLDVVFLQNTIKTLQSLQTLAVTSQINVTPEGRLFYEQGFVSQPPYSVKIYAISDQLAGKLTFQYESLDDLKINHSDLADYIKLDQQVADISALELSELQQIIQSSNLELHVPTEGKHITAYKILNTTQKFWKNVSLFVIFDAIEEKLIFQFSSENKLLESASNQLELLHNQGKISLQALCQLSDETINFEREATLKKKNAEIEARLAKIRQKAIKSHNETFNSQLLGTALQLRDQEINQAFWEVLKSAKYQLLIYSPWVSQAVVDQQFLNQIQKLADCGVWILIGHGIARRQEDEEKLITPEIEAKLRNVKTSEGLPAVQVFWLGDSHVKEVIVDQKIHLCGSHNWLSYRGDYLPRGESVYKVTIPHQVQEAYNFLAHRFQNHAEKLWQDSSQKHDTKLAIQSLCIWGALGMENQALKKIQQNNRLELFPVWLAMVCQGLRSQKIPFNSPIFPTALSLLNQVSLTDTDLQPLRRGWRGVIHLIAHHHRETALNLLNHQVWAQFLRLSIAQETDSPDKFIHQL